MQLNLQQKTENFAQRIFLLPFSWEIKFGVYLNPPLRGDNGYGNKFSF